MVAWTVWRIGERADGWMVEKYVEREGDTTAFKVVMDFLLANRDAQK
jgi:hypothetical protein